MKQLNWTEYLALMAAFRKARNLPEPSTDFLVRYWESLKQVGIIGTAELLDAMKASRDFEYSGYPAPRLLQLLQDVGSDAAANTYGWIRKGLRA